MTTIAYRDGVLAADRLMTGGGARCAEVCKVARSKYGHLAAAAGNASGIASLHSWVVAGCDGELPRYEKGTMDGLVIYPTGRVFYWDGSPALIEMFGPFFAAGSGQEFAFGAMAVGADARRAVEIAIQFDTLSGGRIDVRRLPRKAAK